MGDVMDNQIIESYFLALGWVPYDADANNNIEPKRWWNPINHMKLEELPPILTDYPAFKEHCLLPMEKEGFWFTVNASTIIWAAKLSNGAFGETIKSNNILHAAVKGATSYFEGKK